MGFINSSPYTYGGAPVNSGASLDFVLELDGDFAPAAIDPGVDDFKPKIILVGDVAPIARDHFINDALSLNLPILAFDVQSYAEFPGGLDLKLDLSADLTPIARLSLASPAPILTQLSPTAFQNKRQRSRLLINGMETKFKRATYSKPKGAAGSELNIELSKTALSQIPAGAEIKFQILNYPYGTGDVKTLLNSGKLKGRALRHDWLKDSLSFSSVENLNDKLSLCPRRNLIVYDGAKTEVDVSMLEPLYDTLGHQLLTNTRNTSVLNLYDLLRIAFVEGCGFSFYETDIPNFEITRCDFSITNSYLEAISPFIGIFKPEFVALPGNGLRILNKMQTIPEDFAPTALTANHYQSFALTKAAPANIDGYILQYVGSGAYASVLSETKVTTKELETFAIQTTETTNYYKDSNGAIIRSELIHRRTEKYNIHTLELIQREITDHLFDSLGKKSSSVASLESKVPNPANAFNVELTQVKGTRDLYFYQPDPFNSRRIVPSQIITYVEGLYTIDSDTQQLGEDFQQDIVKEYRAGNVTDSMSSNYGAIETHYQDFKPQRSGQLEVERYTYDHLHDVCSDPVKETISSDASLNGLFSRPRVVVVWREGADIDAVNGAKLVPFPVGELPLMFAQPLAEKSLAEDLDPKGAGRVEIAGFDDSLDRGIFFNAHDRQGASFGTFLAAGFEVEIEPLKIVTNIDVLEV